MTSAAGSSPFDAVDLIRAKRDGHELAEEELRWLVDAYVAGTVPDEQVSAWLMAVYLRGMSPPEVAAFTGAIVASGEVLDLSGLSRPTVDKHSTGGVGDKVSLVLVPLLASLGAAVPQLRAGGWAIPGGHWTNWRPSPGGV